MRFTRLVAAAVLMGVGVSAMAQLGGSGQSTNSDGKVTRRVKIRSADPYLIMLLLSGTQSTSQAPETSTILNLGASGGGGNGGFGGGGPGGGSGNRDRGPGGGSGNRSGNGNGNRNGSGSGNGNSGRHPGGGF